MNLLFLISYFSSNFSLFRNNLLSTRTLAVSQVIINGTEIKLRSTISPLDPNKNYFVQIFANPEPVGVFFNFTTFPASTIFLFTFFKT